LKQVFSFSACAAWANGMEPKNGGYTDWQLDREIERLQAKESQL